MFFVFEGRGLPEMLKQTKKLKTWTDASQLLSSLCKIKYQTILIPISKKNVVPASTFVYNLKYRCVFIISHCLLLSTVRPDGMNSVFTCQRLCS